MDNDKTYYRRLFNGNDYKIEYPNEVFPFEYHKIQLFTSEKDGEWVATEVKTGYKLGGVCATQQEAEDAARAAIDKHGINPTKHSIKEALLSIKQGLFYDEVEKKWQKPMIV